MDMCFRLPLCLRGVILANLNGPESFDTFVFPEVTVPPEGLTNTMRAVFTSDLSMLSATHFDGLSSIHESHEPAVLFELSDIVEWSGRKLGTILSFSCMEYDEWVLTDVGKRVARKMISEFQGQKLTYTFKAHDALRRKELGIRTVKYGC